MCRPADGSNSLVADTRLSQYWRRNRIGFRHIRSTRARSDRTLFIGSAATIPGKDFIQRLPRASANPGGRHVFSPKRPSPLVHDNYCLSLSIDEWLGLSCSDCRTVRAAWKAHHEAATAKSATSDIDQTNCVESRPIMKRRPNRFVSCGIAAVSTS